MQSLNIVFTGKNQVELREEKVRDLAPGEILVQATKSLISTGTESICFTRNFDVGTHWDDWVSYPFHPGYSLVGRVVAIGKGVTRVSEGQRVALRKEHRQYTIIAEQDDIYPVPDGVADGDATWFHIATIVQGGIRRGEHQLGDSTVVVGLGLLGQLVVQYARLLGAQHIIAIDMAEQRLQMAGEHGATATLCMDIATAREEVLRLTGNKGASIAYDVTGAAPVFRHTLGLVKRFGRIVLLGDTGFPMAQQLTKDVITRGLSIVGYHDMHTEFAASDSAYWNNLRQGELFFAYLQRGDMRVHDLITHIYTPAEAEQAYQFLQEERASALGVLFDWT